MSAYIAITYKCNHKCLFCPCRKDKSTRQCLPILSGDGVLERLKRICDNGNGDFVTISGGEPFLHPHIFQILRYISEKRIRSCVLTNSELVSIESVQKGIVENVSPQTITFCTALHASDPELHDKITGVHGSFERSLAAIHFLEDNGFQVSVKHMPNKISASGMSELPGFLLREFNTVSLTIAGMDCCGMSKAEAREICLNFEELSRPLNSMLAKSESLILRGRNVSVIDIPRCVIEPEYRKYVCCGKRKSGISYVAPTTGNHLIDNVASECNLFSEKCKSCSLASSCPGMWRDAFLSLGDSGLNSL